MWKPEHRQAANRSGLLYPSDLTDAEWAIVEPMIPPARHGGRKRSVNVREVLNGIFYILWTGCQWKALPRGTPETTTKAAGVRTWPRRAQLAALKPEWRVSMQALLYRAQSLGLIEQQKAAWLWRRFAIDRIKLREPASLDFPPEIPGVISRMVRLHLDTFGYSSGDLAKIIHANDNLLNEYYDLNASPVVQGMRLRVVR